MKSIVSTQRMLYAEVLSSSPKRFQQLTKSCQTAVNALLFLPLRPSYPITTKMASILVAPLRGAVPKLIRMVPSATSHHVPLAPFRSFPSPASTSRLFSSASRPTKPKSVLDFLPKTFPKAGGAARSSSGQTRAASTAPVVRTSDQVDWSRVGLSVGVAALAAIGLNYALNRETRGALSAAESSYLNETFKFTGVGLLITAVTAKLLHANGGALRLMQLNPWVFMGVGLVASIGSMMGVYYTAPDTPAHYASWALFSALQGVTLSPMFFLNPAILSRAGLYTVGALSGLCYVGSTAQSEQFLYMGGPLMAGLGVLIVASLAPMVMPRMAMRTMSILEHVTAYGGVALFSGFILYDTQKILQHAKLAEAGRLPRDPVRESVSLILDAINLFVRIVQVMMLQQGNKRK